MPILVRRLLLRFPVDQQPLIDIGTPFEIPQGISLLVAESGSGKTSLFRVMAGWFERSDRGPKVMIDADFDPLRDVDFVGNHQTLLPWFTVRKNISLRDRAGSPEMVESLWRDVGLRSAAIDLYPYELSLGMYKRAELVAALCSSASLLLLDEFFTSLDPIARSQCLELIGHLQCAERAIMITTHTPDILPGLRQFGLVRADPAGPITGLELKS